MDGLSSEEDAVELTRLGARQPRFRKQFDHLICKIPLLSWKRRRVAVVPAEAGTNVCVEPHRLARDFVGNPVELLHLLEQGLELIVVDGHVRSDASVRDEAFAFQPRARFSGARADHVDAGSNRQVYVSASFAAMRNSRDAHTGQKATISAGASRASGSRPRSAISLPRPRSRTCIRRTASRWRGSLQARIGGDAAPARARHGGSGWSSRRARR